MTEKTATCVTQPSSYRYAFGQGNPSSASPGSVLLVWSCPGCLVAPSGALSPHFGDGGLTQAREKGGAAACTLEEHMSRKCVCVYYLLSRVQLYATLWTVAHQAPLSVGFPRQEY